MNARLAGTEPALTLDAPNGAHIALTHNETRVLNAAARAEGALASRRCLIEALGANYWDYDERRLEALISRLRCKLPGLGVRGIKGQGYVFDSVRLDGLAAGQPGGRACELSSSRQTGFSQSRWLCRVNDAGEYRAPPMKIKSSVGRSFSAGEADYAVSASSAAKAAHQTA